MELLQLEHFLAVVEERNFTRAAERVGRTQPAVSQSIRKLEEEVGSQLFARDAPEICLTEAGKVLLEYATRMVRLREEASRHLGHLRTLSAGTLSIAAHESAAAYLLPGPLRAYLQKFPDIRVGIYRSRLAEIPHQVLDRAVDLGFVKEAPLSQELQCVHVHTDEMIMIGSARHPLAGRKSVRVRDLGSERFILHHQCAATEQKILALFQEHSTTCNIVAELWSFENIKDFVQQDVGLAFVPRATVLRDLRERTLVEIPVRELDIPRPSLMIYRDGRSLSDAARELIEHVRRFKWPPSTRVDARAS